MVRIYSTQSNNNEWTCKRMYEIPEDFIFVGISKYSKLYLRSSNNSIHEWNLLTGRSTSMFSYEEMIESPKYFKDIIISSNEKFVCLKINDNIIIYSVELEIPVSTLQAKEIEEVQEDCETINDINDKNLQDYDNTTETEMIDDNDDPKFEIGFLKNNEPKRIYDYNDRSKEHIVSPLLLSDDKSFKQCNEWILDIINNKESLLRYGVKLFLFAIKERIITGTLPLLNKYYPEFILKYSLETNMIIDSQSYKIKDKENLHLYSKNPQLIDLTRSILWTKCNIKMDNIKDNIYYISFIYFIIFLTFPILPILLFIFYLLSKYYFINDFSYDNLFNNLIFNKTLKYISSLLTTPTITPSITFMIPYINYPEDYKWFKELIKPQPIPQQYIGINIQNQLFIASIILGFIHLSFEIRQFIYSPERWIREFWNIFDIIAYLLPIITSIKWLQTNDLNDHIIQLFSFSCLFLDIKFLLFFRAFESFVVLFIIIISFAHAFYILLSPRSDYSFDQFTNNNDPNNPWNIAPTYSQVFNNGTMDSFFIQKPDENTNMFIDFRTALLAMYNFLTGDSSALSNWSYSI
ncbi:hypothetical protein RhiirA4_546901 [Rhizophagus irregularis]|uniref:Ion transport domain-containing protein n=1 Tax=Rhizophagus irregularis TaxID=588596 RepID=A0A2I1GZE7_9GLOM|nr:hypothetical protein RhiirA4_546901 [Rhizophagus irregularis]